MGLNVLRKGASGGIMKIVLFGFLAMAVGGLVLMDVGGVFRGGISYGDVAKVGNQSVPLNEFDRTVRNTLNRIGLSPQQAYQYGYVDQILAGELRGRVLRQVAVKKNIEIADQRVAEQIKQMIDPIAMRDGEDPKDVLNRMLLNQGVSESSFVRSMKSDMAATLLTNTIEAGLAKPSKTLVRHLYNQRNETRDVAFISFLNNKVEGIVKPGDEQLEVLYQATKSQYAVPERRVIEVAVIDTKALKETIEISDEEISAQYDNNVDLYTLEETRTIEQALLDNEEEAKGVIQEFKSGKTFKDAVKVATEKLSGYLGEDNVTEATLMESIRDDVLAVEKAGELAGPIQTPLGWYVVHVKEIKEAHTQSLEDVKAEIRDEMLETQLFDQEYDLSTTLDDMLASGASIEEAKDSVPLKITTLSAVDRSGKAEDENKNAFAAFEDERALILETAFELGEGESSHVLETGAGNFIVVSVKTVQEKSYPPFEEIKTKIANKWIEDQKRIENRVRTKAMLDELKTGEQSIKAFASSKGKVLSRRDKLGREDKLDSPLTARTVANIFEAPIGEAFMVDIDGGLAIAVVQDYHWPNNVSEDDAAYQEIVAELSQNTKNEAVMLYLSKEQQELGTRVNRDLLNRIYGPDSQLYSQ